VCVPADSQRTRQARPRHVRVRGPMSAGAAAGTNGCGFGGNSSATCGADERIADERTADERTVDAMPGPGGRCIATASMRSGDGSGGGGDPLRCGGWLFPQQARRTWRRRRPRAATAVCLMALGCWPLSLSIARPLPSALADAHTPQDALTHAACSVPSRCSAKFHEGVFEQITTQNRVLMMRNCDK
jgi:hypothetical protein